MLHAVRVVAALAAVKLAWLVAVVAAGQPAPGAPTTGLAFGVGPTTALALAFGAAGLFLIWASPARDRGWWLGGTLLLTGTAFVDAVLARRTLTGLEGTLGQALAVDAVLPFFWWSFIERFPQTDREDRVSRWCARAMAAVGLLLFAGNLLGRLGPGAPADPMVPFVLTRTRAAYLALVLAPNAAGLAYLWWKGLQARSLEAQRVRIFATGLLLGCGPLTADVLLSAVSPAYDEWAWRPEVMAMRLPLLFAALAVVPLVTAYSVLVDHVVDLRVALRAAAQYALAKYTLLAVVSLPFVLLAVYVFQHRGEAVGTLFEGPRVVLSAALVGLGVAGLRRRHAWLRTLDERFFRGDADSSAVISTLVSHAHAAVTERELSTLVRDDVASALRAEHATLLVSDTSRTALVDPSGRVPSLGSSAHLALILAGDSSPLDVATPPAGSVLARLPAVDRRWLAEGRFDVLVPIRRSPTTLAAVLALGPKRSGLPYSRADHRVLSAIAAAVGLAIENHRLKSSPSGDDEEPAEECLGCGVLQAAGAAACACGGALAPAPVPLVLRNAFRIERRVGAGGMGVVYRAQDLSLTRTVAIKTLPRVSASRAERLRDEARTMARLAHPHLATIHGVETWRATPLLIVEYLAGGTLADRLRTGPLTLNAVVQLGTSLADALEHIHGADMVHCDIKPSNIGFGGSGTVKLLDFGLAQWFADVRQDPDADQTDELDDTTTVLGPDDRTIRPASGRVAGTPLYMAPEALDAQRPTPLFDLWSTAVVLFEALAGHHPFGGGPADQVLSRIRHGNCLGLDALAARWPGPCVETLTRCLSPDRAARPASAAALRERLQLLRSHAEAR